MIQTPEELLDRLPPQNLDAERGVLGSLLLDPRLCDDVACVIGPDDFYAEAHRKLYGHLAALHAEGSRIDAVLLRERLVREGDLEAVGGAAYLAEVVQSVPYAANAVYYARIVRDKARLRGLIHVATDMLSSVYDGSEDAQALVDRAEKDLRGVNSQGTLDDPVPVGQVVTRVLDQVQFMQDRQGYLGLMTGLLEFDQQTGGLFPAELIILAARTSVGKTALACQISHWAAAAGRLVYYVSLEMRATTLVLRQASAVSGISLHRIRSQQMTPEECQRLLDGLATVSTGTLVLHDRPRMGVGEIARAGRRLSREGLALVVVDYLQLLQVPPGKMQRYEQIGRLTHELKALAVELDVPVLVLCQLSRAAEENVRPELRHLRESGDIEQDADMVLMIHRPREGICELDARGKPVPGGSRWDAELLLRKNRNGATGEFRLGWEAARTRFRCWGDTPIGPF